MNPPMGVSVTTEADARAPRAAAFACIAPIDLSKIFPRYGPLPAVVGTSDESGAWDHVGATRTVNLSDGSSVREELTAYVEGERFLYRLSPVKSPLRFVVRYAAGAWEFTDQAEGVTHVRWTYTFHPRQGRRWLVSAFLRPLWERYQRQALALAVREAEQL